MRRIAQCKQQRIRRYFWSLKTPLNKNTFKISKNRYIYFENSVENDVINQNKDIEKVREIIKISMDPLSLETPIGEEEDSHLGDFIPDGPYGNGNARYSWYDEGNTELAYYPAYSLYGMGKRPGRNGR